MNTNFVNLGHKLSRFSVRFYIILSWLVGLILGLHIIPALTMPAGAFAKPLVSDVRHFPLWWLFSILPLVLAIIFVQIRKPHSIPFLCLAKSLLLGFSLFILSEQFPFGTWLAALLFIFPDIISGCLLLWFSLRQGTTKQPCFSLDVAVILFIQTAALCFDVYLIAPLLQKLF